MEANKAFAFFFLYRCLGAKEGSEIRLRILYERYCKTYSVLTSTENSVNKTPINSSQFYKILRVIIKEVVGTNLHPFPIEIVRATKGLVLKNLYLNEYKLITTEDPDLEVFKKSLTELGLIDYTSKFLILEEPTGDWEPQILF